MVEAGDLRRFGVVRPKLRPGPLFLRIIVARKKQNLGVGTRRLLVLTHDLGRNEHGRAGLVQTGEVVEVVVLAESVESVGPFGLHRREQHHHAAVGLARKRHAARAVVGVGLAVKGTSGNGQQQDDWE